MKNLILIMCLTIISGCSTFINNNGTIDTYSCESGYVKYLKYDKEKIEDFKKNENKTAYFIKNSKDLFEKCESYPCQMCNQFLCKQHDFKKVYIYDNEKNRYINFKMVDKKIYNKNFFKAYNKKKITKNFKSEYIWNVFNYSGYEYEQVFEEKTGNLVYEIVTPHKIEKEIIVSECDVEAFSIFNNFFYSFAYK